MTYILCTIMLFLCIVNEEVSKAEMTPRTLEVSVTCRNADVEQSEDEIKKLIRLRSAVSELVATYDRSIMTNILVYSTQRVILRQKGRRGWRHKKRDVKLKKIYKKLRYPTPGERLTLFYTHFLNLFSENDETKRRHLNSTYHRPRNLDACYMQVFSVFMEYCYYAYYKHGGIKTIKQFLSRLCSAEWLTTERITYVFEKTCRRRFTFDTHAS